MKWYAYISGDYSFGYVGKPEVRKFTTKEKMEKDIFAPYVLSHEGPFFAKDYKEAFDKIKNIWYN